MTGWGTHSYDQINRALGTDDTGPVEVLLEEPVAERDTGKFVSGTTVGGDVIGDTGDIDTGTAYHRMAKLSGPRAKMTMRFASGTELRLHLDGDRGPGLGAIFVGEKGKIEINRNKLASNPKELVLAADNPGPNKRSENAYHLENWIECIKSRKTCNADIEIGQRATTLCYLVNIVRDVGRVGRPLRRDPVAERFTNCDEANQLLDRPRRKGYELPDLAEQEETPEGLPVANPPASGVPFLNAVSERFSWTQRQSQLKSRGTNHEHALEMVCVSCWLRSDGPNERPPSRRTRREM